MKRCSDCIYMKRLRGQSDTRWGCYHLLIAFRPLPREEQLIRAPEIDLRPLIRGGYTTREHLECATRIGPEAGACQWWEPKAQESLCNSDSMQHLPR